MGGETDKPTNEMSATVVKATTIVYTKCCERISTISSVRIVGVYGRLRIMRNT